MSRDQPRAQNRAPRAKFLFFSPRILFNLIFSARSKGFARMRARRAEMEISRCGSRVYFARATPRATRAQSFARGASLKNNMCGFTYPDFGGNIRSMAMNKPLQAKKKTAKEKAEATRKREEKRAKLAAAREEGAKIRESGKWAGRPPDYSDDFCQIVIDMASEGCSVVEIAAKIGVVRDTIWAWAKEHERFSVALTRGKELCQAWWESLGRRNHTDAYADGAGSKFNDRLWGMNMRCRFKDDWHEKKDEDGAEAVKRLAEIAALLTSGKRPE